MKAPLGEPDHVQFVPSYRVVLTPGDWGASRGTNTLGQSGHRFSPFRDDQLEHWASGEGHPWRWGGPPPEEVIGVLRLRPL
ncbi:MAG: penicillin acylase family protein [Gammaproteobacteria bacterium]|nr:penicillin acylase family protein [Gammaproteobacteria bacterium]